MARSTLPTFGYSVQQIEVVAEIISATKRNVEPKNILEEIMCDADYDYLGRPDYHVIAKKLREEMSLHDTHFSDSEWINYQLNFLENEHQFYTESAKNIRFHGKQARIRKLKQKLNLLIEKK